MKKIFLTIFLLALISTSAHATLMYTVDGTTDPDAPTNYEMVPGTPGAIDYINARWEHIDGRIHTLETAPAGGTVPASTSPTVDAAGEVAVDTDGPDSDFDQGVFTFYDGTRQMWGISVDVLTGLNDEDALTYDAALDKFVFEAQSGSSDVTSLVDLDDVDSPVGYTSGYVLKADGASYGSGQLAHSDLSLDDGLNPHSLTAAELSVLDLGGGTLTGFLILDANPTAALHATTKQYTDSVAAGIRLRVPCEAASTANVDESAELEADDVIDGYTLVEGDRVLLKDQTAPEENGVYVAVANAAGAASRATDFDTYTANEIYTGSFFTITNGTANDDLQYILTTPNPITVDTTELTFSYFGTVNAYVAGDGIDLSTLTFSTDIKANDGLEIVSTELTVDYDETTIGITGNKLAVLGIPWTSINSFTGSEFNDLEDVNIGAPSDNQIPKWDSGTSKWIAASDETASGSAGGDVIVTVSWINLPKQTVRTATEWTNMPSAGTQFGLGYGIKAIDLTAATEYRIVVNMHDNSAASGADLNLQYSTDAISYYAADSAAAGELDISTNAGILIGDWATLVAGAKTSVYIAILGKGGDGAADPDFSSLMVQFKYPAGVLTEEQIEDYAGAMWTGNTETLITITYQDSTGDIDAVVEDDLSLYDWTSVDATDLKVDSITQAYDADLDDLADGTLTGSKVEDIFLRNNAADTTTGNITLNNASPGDSPAVIFNDGGGKTFTIAKQDDGEASLINDEGAIYFKPSNDLDDYWSMYTSGNVPYLRAVGGNAYYIADGGEHNFGDDDIRTTGTIYGTFSITFDDDTSFDDGVGDSPKLKFIDADDKEFQLYKMDSGPAILYNNEGSIDFLASGDTDDYFRILTTANEPILTVVGATSMNYGDGSTTDHTFRTDATGDAEFVVPNDSIGLAEINWAAIASTELSDTAGLLYETELDSEAELEGQIGDMANILQATEIDTEAELVALIGDLATIVQNTDIDTKAELEAILGDVADIAEADGDVYTGAHDWGGADSTEIKNAEGDATLTAAGMIATDGADDALAIHFGSGGEIAGEAQISAIQAISVVVDPGAWYDTDTQVFLFTVGDEAPNGIIIDEWKVSCNVDPDVEMDLDLKHADAFIGLASAQVMDILDTSSGVSTEDTDANIHGGDAVPNGDVVYLEFGADPEGTCVQMIFEMWYHAEED